MIFSTGITSSVSIRGYNDTIYAVHEIATRHAIDMATIIVVTGPKGYQRFFHVQEPLSTARSQCFEITLKSDLFMEGKECNIGFTKQDPDTLSAYLSST